MRIRLVNSPWYGPMLSLKGRGWHFRIAPWITPLLPKVDLLRNRRPK